MHERQFRPDLRQVSGLMLAALLAIGTVPATAKADDVVTSGRVPPPPILTVAPFTWNPAGASPSLSGDPAFTADAIEATHYLWAMGSTINTYTVHFLEQITGFTLGSSPVAPPGLNGTPGAPGSYGLYLTMQTQTRFIGPPNTYRYSGGQLALMLDPGNNNGAASSTPSGLTFANTGPTGTADDITLATGSLVWGHFFFMPAAGIASIGDFEQTFRPASGEAGFFVAPVAPNDIIELVDTTFTGDLKVTADPTASDPTQTINVLNGGSAVLALRVPEPASIVLFSSGLLAVLALRRRPRR